MKLAVELLNMVHEDQHLTKTLYFWNVINAGEAFLRGDVALAEKLLIQAESTRKELTES